MYVRRAESQPLVAADSGAVYDVGPAPRRPYGDAVADLAAAVQALADAGAENASADEVRDGLRALARLQTRLAAEEARLLQQMEQREAYRHDACISAVGWLRYHAGLGLGDARRRVRRAQTLPHFPSLAKALDAGEITTSHVDAVAARTTPARRDDLTPFDDTLARLARDADPRDVATAVQRIIDQVDDDGSEDPPPCETEKLRDFGVRDGFAGMGEAYGTLTPLLRELIRRVHEVYGTPDQPDQPRTPGQRQHDSLQAALAAALSASPNARVGGVMTHAVMLLDMFTLMGRDDLATIRPKLGELGVIDPEVARHILNTTSVSMRAVLSLGPWLPVNVGRARRTLPDWLRTALQMTFQKCCGLGCDAPFAWTEADHMFDWAKGGPTGLANSAPPCKAHHKLKTEDGWSVSFDIHTGTITWTAKDGRTFQTRVPDP